MKNMGNLMKQAQKVQKQMLKMQEGLLEEKVSAQAGGGMVKATVNGKGELLKLEIEPEIVNPDDLEMLTEILVAAVGEAQRRAQSMVQEKMGKLTGGLGMPPGMF